MKMLNMMRKNVTYLNLGFLGLTTYYGLSPLFNFAVPIQILYISWVLVGYASLMFLLGKSEI